MSRCEVRLHSAVSPELAGISDVRGAGRKPCRFPQFFTRRAQRMERTRQISSPWRGDGSRCNPACNCATGTA